MLDLSVNPLARTNTVAGTYARLDSTPGLGELFINATVGTGDLTTLTSGRIYKLFIVPFSMTITGGWFCSPVNSTGTTSANYLRITLNRYRAGSQVEICGGTTAPSGAWPSGISANVGYSFNSLVFSNTSLQAGDVLGFMVTQNGSATMLDSLLPVTVSFVPA